ncbi:MAG TPA: NADH-quinone oxidoreductase subunit K [Clostridia bacterium]|jgi:multisubunit Na+/H+ antiporter MnhC subunit|nr:NADH-quinone oxidoreductase subunit K [Clostridia bacterium]
MTVSTIMLIAGLVLILTGCFELIRTRHMLKIIIALELAIKAVSMFIVLGGWLNGNMPVAESFVVSVIVIEVVVATVLSGIAISIYHKYGNMDIRSLRNLKG